MLIRHTGSQFVWEFKKNREHLGFKGRLKISSIRLDSIESTLIDSLDEYLSYWKSICARLGFDAGLKILLIRLNLIESTHSLP